MFRILSKRSRPLLTALMMTASALAVAKGGPVEARQAQAETEFRIPSQSMASALAAFGAQSGYQVSADAALTRGRTSPGVSGRLSVGPALEALLGGSGLAYSVRGRTIVIDEAPRVEGDVVRLGTLRVEGAGAGGAASGGDFGGDGDPAETPYVTPGSTSYISAAQIERFSGTTAADIFKLTPGVISGSNHNGASVDLNIRGLQGQNRVRLTIDGTQQSTSTWRGYQGADERVYLDPDLIGGVTVEKGPTGGARGAGAIGGVVSVRTLSARDIVAEGKETGFRFRVGTSDNAIKAPSAATMEQRTDAPTLGDLENGFASLVFARATESFDFVFALTHRNSGNYFAGQHGDATYRYNSYADVWVTLPLSFTKPGEEVFNTSAETTSGLVKGLWRWGEGQALELGYVRYDSTFGEVIQSLLFTQDSSFRQVKLTEAATDTLTARYRWNPDERIDLRFNLWATRVEATTRSVGPAFYLPPWITPTTRPPSDDPRHSVTDTYGVDLSNSSFLPTPRGDVRLEYGASYLIEDADGEAYLSRMYANEVGVVMQPSVGTRALGSLFGSAEWSARDWLSLRGGLRYDAYWIEEKGRPTFVGTYADKDGGRLSPSISATVSAGDGWQVYGLYAEGMRPPSLRESIGSDSMLFPNPNLRPEIARNVEFGVNFSRDDLVRPGDKARMKLAGFINNYDDYISRTNTTPDMNTNIVFTTTNLDKATYEGLELSASYDAGVVFGDLAATYYTGFEFCARGKPCVSDALRSDYALNQLPPEHVVAATIGARLFKERVTLGARVQRVGERLAPLGDERQRTGYWNPYTVVDAYMSAKVTPVVTVDLRGENLTDQYYVDALAGWTPSPGRTIRLSLTAQF